VWLYGIGALVTAILALLAVRATADRPDSGVWDAVFDVAVGLGFIVAALIAPGRMLSRAPVAAVGFAWLLGSVWSDAVLLHMTVLAILLVTFPTVRPRRPM